MLAIQTENLQKSYRQPGKGRIQALQGLDLQVEPGRIFGFIGPNGAGKSTTIKILAGLVWPDKGQARVMGHPCGSVPSRAQLGYLPEVALYHEFMSVWELLEVHAALAGIPSSRRRAACERALQITRLSERRLWRLRQLSKGMQQRFGLAQALVADPPVLILDEPTSGLDPLAQKEIKDIILELKGRGITIFFSSHQLTEVEMICDVIGILHRGRLLTCKPLDELLAEGPESELRLRAAPEAVDELRRQGWDPRPQNGTVLLRVERPRAGQAVEAARAAGAELLELQPLRPTLEQVFFDLVTAADSR
ncbi:MAG TPA: ABC transporter ATP-binding protein [Candidatus Nitrosotenuis sp.]|jgi:ABC-2 type transport system ATP-binding protein|nr:ABC transporter ATP-binding protein [Candidatus Nitrosotenuis sp.]